MKAERRQWVMIGFISLLLIVATAAFAADDTRTGKNYKARITYSETTQPGDPIVVKILFTGKASFTSAKASVAVAGSTKKTVSAKCYKISPSDEWMCLLPLDSTAKTGNYTLTISASGAETELFSCEYVVSVMNKEFVSETIELDATNTAIKTDTSTKRAKQIDRLNEVLFTTNYDAQYDFETFIYPVTSKRRTSFYGDRRIYAYSNGKSEMSLHYGIDYGIPKGTSVAACAPGKVVLAEDRVTTGWSVVIEHFPGLYSLYYHMDSLQVTEGDIVQAGTRIGLSGATGLATGPHLHWEIRLLGTAVNPDFFVTTPLRSSASAANPAQQ